MMVIHTGLRLFYRQHDTRMAIAHLVTRLFEMSVHSKPAVPASHTVARSSSAALTLDFH